MQLESLAALVVVLWFLPNTAGFGFGFSLSPSLPPSHSFSFVSPCLHLPVPTPGQPGSVTPLWGVRVLGHVLGGEEPPLILGRDLGRNLSMESALFLLQRAPSQELLVLAPGRSGGTDLTLCPLPPPQTNQALTF